MGYSQPEDVSAQLKPINAAHKNVQGYVAKSVHDKLQAMATKRGDGSTISDVVGELLTRAVGGA